MKTAELIPPLLDYWVAMAEGRKNVKIWGGRCFCDHPHSIGTGFMPTEFWGVGGPIIERELISIVTRDVTELEGTIPVSRFGEWAAIVDVRWAGGWEIYGATERGEGTGPTALIAAMRAYVASKYGEEVPDEAKP